MPRAQCCGTSVGVLVRSANTIAMIERAWFPWGVAPFAGHVKDEHANYIEAAHNEVHEEGGITIRNLQLAWEGHLPNLCSSPPADPPGHHWRVYFAEPNSLTLTPSPEETNGAGWYTPSQIKELSGRTLDYAHGRIAEDEAKATPPLEPVWHELFTHVFGSESSMWVYPMSEAVRSVYMTPPAVYWRG